MSRRACRLTAVLLACLALGPGAAAQDDVRVQARLDARKIGLEDLVQLTLTVEGSRLSLREEPALPRLVNLRLAGGPAVSTSLSIVNGAMTSSRTYTWVLQPTAVGRAEVGPLQVKLEGGERSTGAIEVEVVPGSIRPQASRQPAEDEDPFEALRQLQRGSAPAAKLFVEAVPSRSRLHVGEPLTLTYYLYTQAPVSDLQFAQAPQFPGFWVENLDKPEAAPAGEAVTFQGEAMQRFPVLRRLLFPTKAGRLTLPPVSFRLRLPRRGFFDAGSELERSTKALTINALPLPEAPGFSGAVGRFEVQASLDRTEVALGEAANLRIKVEGKGNLKWVEKGPQPSLQAAKLYPPQVKSEIESGPSGMSGSRTWEFVVVPETAGTLEIPGLSFTYFDPEAGQLKTAQSKPLALVVHGTLGATTPAVSPPPSRSGSPLALRADLDPPWSLLPQLSAGMLSLGLGLVLVLHALLWGGAALADRRLLAGHHAPRQSVRQALAGLSKAERPGLTKEAAAALIEKAIHEVFGPVDEGGPPPGEREQAALAVLQEAQFIRYAPQLGDYSEKIREVAARTAEVIRRWA